MRIIRYEDAYHDDMIDMVMKAKSALGKTARINDDLLDVKTSYLDKGDSFFLALDENSRVIGCVGFSRIEDSDEAFLHRFYVKAELKHQGIGTELLKTVEEDMTSKGIKVSKVHLGDRQLYFESWSFYPKNGYVLYDEYHMKKVLEQQ